MLGFPSQDRFQNPQPVTSKNFLNPDVKMNFQMKPTMVIDMIYGIKNRPL